MPGKSSAPAAGWRVRAAWRGTAEQGGGGQNTQDSAACANRVFSTVISNGNPLKHWKAINCLSGVKEESMCLPVMISFCF